MLSNNGKDIFIKCVLYLERFFHFQCLLQFFEAVMLGYLFSQAVLNVFTSGK